MTRLRVVVFVNDLERRNRLVELLRRGDHEVVAAPDPGSAAEAIREPGVDTLIIDVDSAGLDREGLWGALTPHSLTDPESLDAAERRHLAKVLRHTGGNKRKAAHLLGISRSTLLNKVRKYGLEPR
ncbi:MAG TPA: helix-turn-helix domain-containing protein [Gemmatimonadales bacterium]|nr:helix-turn-helix domain-containing protein [Gemmatimonadales bacterium]